MTTHDPDQNDADFQAFQQQMQEKKQVKQIKEEKISEHKKKELMYKRRKWRLQMKRTQMYLGLISFPSIVKGAKNVDSSSSPADPAHQRLEMSPNGIENTTSRTSRILTSLLPTIFVCVDIEAYEFNQQQITEIGVSTLNSQDLLGQDPGSNGKYWAEKIHSRHFRIKEYAHRRNRVHIESCPDDFNFGESEWISKKDAPSTMKSCFTTPLSVSYDQLTPPTNYKFVLVAHNATSDITYLENIGYNPAEDIFDIIDSSDLANANGREINQPGLSTLLLRYGIAAKNLHNAGNDAHYTLRVMLAMAVNNFHHKRSPEEWAIEKTQRIKTAGERAKAKAEAKAALDMEGWSTSENDDVPGSALVPTREQRPKREIESGNRDGYGGRADRGGGGGRGGRGGREERGGRGDGGGRGGAKAAPKTFYVARGQDHQSNSQFPRLPSIIPPNTIRSPPVYQLQPGGNVPSSTDKANYTPRVNQPAVSTSHPPKGSGPTGFKQQPGTTMTENVPPSNQPNRQPPRFYPPPPPPDRERGNKTRASRSGAVPPPPIGTGDQTRRRGDAGASAGAGAVAGASVGADEGAKEIKYVLDCPSARVW